MYLSKIHCQTESPHRLVMAGFPDSDSDTPRSDWNILYRIEKADLVLVQSEIAPDWSKVLPRQKFQVKQYLPHIENGENLLFRLAFNSIARQNGKDRSIPPEQWLSKRDLGASLQVQSSALTKIRDRSSTGHPVTLNCCTVNGTLTVDCVERFSDVIRSGIGRGRAYGCGLLSIAKL